MAGRISISVPVYPWFYNHHFVGKTIFPAVEIMLLLAEVAHEVAPHIPLQHMVEARFLRLLEIPDGSKELDLLVEYEESPSGLLCKLLQKVQFKKMSRTVVYATLRFARTAKRPNAVQKASTREDDKQVDCKRIYKELVPFGKTYRTICGPLHLRGKRATTTLRAADVGHTQKMEPVLGSPFPLDGAMHAACVLGQCVAGFVPFPVGFADRVIHNPTVCGVDYLSTVELVLQAEDELQFNLAIFDSLGHVCETVAGLVMRDVTGGRVTPPLDLPDLLVSP